MSSVSGKDADFDISASSHKHSSHAGSEESLEPDGDETGYINQTANEESDTKNELESATEDFGESTLGSLPSKSSDDEDKDENVTTTVSPPCVNSTHWFTYEYCIVSGLGFVPLFVYKNILSV